MKSILFLAAALPGFAWAGQTLRYDVKLSTVPGSINVEQELNTIKATVEGMKPEAEKTVRDGLEKANRGTTQTGPLTVVRGDKFFYLEGPVMARGSDKPATFKEMMLEDCTLSTMGGREQMIYAGSVGNLFPTPVERWLLLGKAPEGSKFVPVDGQPKQTRMVPPGGTPDSYILHGDPKRPERIEAFFALDGKRVRLFDIAVRWQGDIPAQLNITRYRDDQPSAAALLKLTSQDATVREVSADSFFIKDGEVLDMRLSENKPESLRNVRYHWEGRLPSREELLKLEDKQFEQMADQPSPRSTNNTFLISAVAFLAVAGCACVFWRKRQPR